MGLHGADGEQVESYILPRFLLSSVARLTPSQSGATGSLETVVSRLFKFMMSSYRKVLTSPI